MVVLGCSDGNYGGEAQISPAESAKQLEDRIKAIENNDKMPPQAKAAAIAALRNSQAMGKGQEEPK